MQNQPSPLSVSSSSPPSLRANPDSRPRQHPRQERPESRLHGRLHHRHGLGGIPAVSLNLVTKGLDTLGVKIDPIPKGVGGNKSNDMLARLKTDALDKKPDWLLLSCGVNDVWSRSIDLDTFKKNITSIVDQAQAAGIKVMIVTPTPIYELGVSEFSKLSDYVAWEIQLAKDRKLPSPTKTPLTSPISGRSRPIPTTAFLTVDGVHPNPDGHQIIATTILEAFGVTPDQMTKVKEAWNAMPDGRESPLRLRFRRRRQIHHHPRAGSGSRETGRRQKAGTGRIPPRHFMEAWREELTSLPTLDGIDGYAPERAVTKMTKAKVDKLVPPDTAMPTPPPRHQEQPSLTPTMSPSKMARHHPLALRLSRRCHHHASAVAEIQGSRRRAQAHPAAYRQPVHGSHPRHPRRPRRPLQRPSGQHLRRFLAHLPKARRRRRKIIRDATPAFPSFPSLLRPGRADGN